jgi:hypothetical protein
MTEKNETYLHVKEEAGLAERAQAQGYCDE